MSFSKFLKSKKIRIWIALVLVVLIAGGFYFSVRCNLIPRVNPAPFLSTIGLGEVTTEVNGAVYETLTKEEKATLVQAYNDADMDWFDGLTSREVAVLVYGGLAKTPNGDSSGIEQVLFRYHVAGKSICFNFHALETNNETHYYMCIGDEEDPFKKTNIYYYKINNPDALRKIDALAPYWQ